MSDMEKQALYLDTPSEEKQNPIESSKSTDEDPQPSKDPKDAEEKGVTKRKLDTAEEDDGLKQTTLDGVISSDKEGDKVSQDEEKDEKEVEESAKADDKGNKEGEKEPVAKKAKLEKSNGQAKDEATKEANKDESKPEPQQKPNSKSSDQDSSLPSKPVSSSTPRLAPATTNQPSNEPSTNPGDSSHLDHPENWTTGNDPATDKQVGYIKVLEKQKGVESGVDVEHLGKSEASEIIGELKGA